MTLPFLHVRSLGLHLTETHIRAVELRRLGRRVRVVDRWDVPVEEGLAEALQQVAAHVEREPRRVCAHVDPALVRHYLVPAPGDSVDTAAWAEAEAGRRLPPAADSSAFLVRHRVLGDESGTRALLVLARRDAVEGRTTALTSAGLRPTFVGSAPVELACAFAFASDFVEGTKWMLLLETRPACLLQYERGELVDLVDIDADTPAEALALAQLEAFQQASLHTATPTPALLDSLLVTGLGAEGLDADASAACPQLTPEATCSLSPSYAVAAALAVRGLYERPDAPSLGINLLEPTEARRAWDALGRAEATRAGLFLGTVILLFLLALTATTALLDRRLAEAEARVVPLADRLAEVEGARAAVERLRSDFAEAEALSAERTGAAHHLAHVSAALPDSAWLTGLVLQLGDTDAPVLIARGDALGGGPVARFLAALEQTPPLTGVALVYAEHISADEVYRQTGRYRVPLRRFEIQASLSPASPPRNL